MLVFYEVYSDRTVFFKRIHPVEKFDNRMAVRRFAKKSTGKMYIFVFNFFVEILRGERIENEKEKSFELV